MDRGESNSFPSVHGRPCSYVDAAFSTLREAPLFDNIRGCPPTQMSEMVSTRFDRVMRTPGLEDPIGGVHQRIMAVAGCRWPGAAHAHASDVRRQVSRFVVGSGGKTEADQPLGNPIYHLDLVPGCSSLHAARLPRALGAALRFVGWTRPRAGVSSAHAGGVLVPRFQTPELGH
jgi:hypothetical protein